MDFGSGSGAVGKEAAVRARTKDHFDGQGVTGVHCHLLNLPAPISPRCIYAFYADSRRRYTHRVYIPGGCFIFENTAQILCPNCDHENSRSFTVFHNPSKSSTKNIGQIPQ